MNLVDGLLGSLMGAGATGMIEHFIEQNGGVQGLVTQFEQKGCGNLVQSWIGTGANQPITAEQIHHVIGGTAIETIAARFGMQPDQLEAKIAELLPQVVDRMTPHGIVPNPSAAA